MPLAVDPIDDPAGKAFAAWPERIYILAGTTETAARAAELASAALDRAATPAGRTTSLPTPPRVDQVPASGAA